MPCKQFNCFLGKECLQGVRLLSEARAVRLVLYEKEFKFCCIGCRNAFPSSRRGRDQAVRAGCAEEEAAVSEAESAGKARLVLDLGNQPRNCSLPLGNSLCAQRAEPGTPLSIEEEVQVRPCQSAHEGQMAPHQLLERVHKDMGGCVESGEGATKLGGDVEEDGEKQQQQQQQEQQQQQQPGGPSTGSCGCEEPAASTPTWRTSLTIAAAAGQLGSDPGQLDVAGDHGQQPVRRKRKAAHPCRVAVHLYPARVQEAPGPCADNLLLADAQMDGADAAGAMQLRAPRPNAASPFTPRAQSPDSPRAESPGAKLSMLTITPPDLHKMFGPKPKLPAKVRFRVSLHGTLQAAQATGKVLRLTANRFYIHAPCCMSALVGSLIPQKRLQRTRLLDFAWSLSSPGAAGGLPLLLLDLQPVTVPPSAETGVVRPLAAAAGRAAADGQRRGLPGKVRARVGERGGLRIGTSAPPSGAAGRSWRAAQVASLLKASRQDGARAAALGAAHNQTPRKRARLSKAEQQARSAYATPQEEQAYKQEILKSLQEMRPDVSMEDVERYYSHANVKGRRSSAMKDKFFHVQAPSGLPAKLRSYLEVARFILDHLGQPQQETPRQGVSRKLRYPGQDDAPPLRQQSLRTLQLGAEQHAGGPGEQSLAQLLQALSGALDLVKAGTVLPLGSDAQRLQAAALAVVFGEGILEDPGVRSLLLSLPPAPAAAAAGGEGAWGQSLAGMLPLLAGNLCVLPGELLRQVAAELGLAVQDQRLWAKLLVWSAGAAADMISARAKGGPSTSSAEQSSPPPPRQLTMKEVMELEPLAAKLCPLVPSGSPGLTPMKALLPAFRQVGKQGPAVLALAACLMHAHGGRVGEERDGLGELRGRAMRLLARAACSGEPSLDALRAAVKVALQRAGPGGGRLEVAEDADAELADDVVYAACEAADELFLQQEAVGLGAGATEELRSSLSKACLAAGRALHAVHALQADQAQLAHSIAGVVRLVRVLPGQRRLPLPTAVAAVAAGYHPDADDGMGFLDLLEEVQGLLGT